MPLKAKATRVDNAYQRLKSEILRGDLPPGFQAPEPDIASRLGMSRTPVREALIRLEAEGLVDLVPRRGAKVLPIARKDICEIYQVLSALEGLAARLAAARSGDAGIGKDIDGLLDNLDEALSTGNMATWAVLDDRLHRWIAALSGNARLEAGITGFLDQIYRASTFLFRLNKAPAVDTLGHRKLCAAIQAGDEEGAAEIARVHRLTRLTKMSALLEDCGLNQV